MPLTGLTSYACIYITVVLYYKWANYLRQTIDTVKNGGMLLVSKEVID